MKKNSLLLFFFLGWMNIAFNQQANIRYDKGSERYGVINWQKDTIVPFSFNQISFVEPNYFLVSHSNGKLKTTYGLYDTLGNNLLPVQYTGILVDPTADFIHFYTKDSSGIYEPIQHKKLTFEGQQYIYPIYSPRVELKYYCAQSEDAFTLFDTKWNKLFSFTGQMIQHRENVHGNSQFVVKNKRTKLLGLLSQEGQLLIPCSYTSLEQPIDHFATFGNGTEWLGRTKKGTISIP
ncbi:MAG: WG repeat-containing protein [Fluviicola sp.]|nr:WG repeat-containing protein [Fluviicola sp.]